MFVPRSVRAAIREGRRADLREALAAGLDPDGCFRYGTLLTEAVMDGRLAIVRMLLEAGANPDKPAEHGCPPLCLAVIHHKIPIAIALIEDGGATVDQAETAHGATPLYEAIRSFHKHGSLELVRLLLDRGADPDRPNAHGVSPRSWSQHQTDALLLALLDTIPVRTVHAQVVPRRTSRHPSSRRFPPDFLDLYNELVPSRGPAATRTGELLRAIEKLRNEALGNGNINWGPPFAAMLEFIRCELEQAPHFEAALRAEIAADLAHLFAGSGAPELAGGPRAVVDERVYDRLLDRIMDDWRAGGGTPRITARESDEA
ncbi:MAG: ankyrin repeat protein [Deltaproteobacteria bacterium]|nr:ankyrin repeat protein [Deltaproteobacteria bacterium]